jgi:bifunctional lysine-specific demethylase and histidyl-hydroxylase NO66
MSLRLPSFRLVKEGATLPPSRYTKTARTGSQSAPGMADAAAIFRQFDDGATIVLQGMHRFWLPLALFCRDLELALGHPTQVNAYITPPGSRGLAVHRDEHDVFVLQSHGTKRWQVYEPADLPPARDPVIEAELAPGDCLYIPKGFPHAASTQRAASVHLTIGILSTTWMAALREVVKLAEEEPAFSEPLPMRFAWDPEAFRTDVQDRLHDFGTWTGKVDPADVADRLSRRFLTTRQPLLAGHMRQLLEGVPELSDDSRVRRRAGSMCVLRTAGDELSVLLGDRELRMPAWLRPALEEITGREEVRVAALEPYLDHDGRLVLVRRLIREGLLEVAG